MVVREGDTVTILRGNFQDVEGKVAKVDRRRGYVYIEGVTRERADGTSRQIPIHSSKVVLRRLTLDDKRRKEILERRVATLQPKVEDEKPKSSQRGKRAEPTEDKEAEQEKEA
jgi:ribosomal protein L24